MRSNASKFCDNITVNESETLKDSDFKWKRFISSIISQSIYTCCCCCCCCFTFLMQQVILYL